MITLDEETIEHVLYLIDIRKGDSGRLNYILSMLQEGRPLYVSDRKYLESLIVKYIEPSKRKTKSQQSTEELKTELAQVKQRIERYEKRGYKKVIGRKSIFFFVTFFFGYHAMVNLFGYNIVVCDIQHCVISHVVVYGSQAGLQYQHINPYLFPLYQVGYILPSQVITIMTHLGISWQQIIVFTWSVMILVWIILGFAYLVKFMRSRYNPVLH